MRRFFRQTIENARRTGFARFAPRSGRPGLQGGGPKAATARPYSAVTVRPGLFACERVAPLIGRRMLEKDAPVLPVPGCDARTCDCRFEKFADRRSGDDRRTPFAHNQFDQFRGGKLQPRQSGDRRAVRGNNRPRAYFNNYD